MELPSYEGVVESWKVNLIIRRAKRYGFKPHELPDALQEAVLVVLEFEYDPNHADGATERTALTSVIDNRLRNMKRSAARYQAHLERMGEDTTEPSGEAVDQRAIDIAIVIAELPQRDQVVCRGLAAGLSKAQLAEQLGCSRRTIDRIIGDLRDRFERLGLAGWVGA